MHTIFISVANEVSSMLGCLLHCAVAWVNVCILFTLSKIDDTITACVNSAQFWSQFSYNITIMNEVEYSECLVQLIQWRILVVYASII